MGGALPVDFERRDDVKVAECLDMEADKTAALMACACSIGAIYTGAPAALVLNLAEFGTGAGLAFQLADDMLGIWGATEVTGKPVGSDLRARKKSMPIVAALTSGTDASAELSDLLAGQEPLTDEQVARATSLVEQAGGRDQTEAMAAKALDSAFAALGRSEMAEDVRSELSGIAEFITARQW
jgi:geranylgeranyl diphosphate synthase, type I